MTLAVIAFLLISPEEELTRLAEQHWKQRDAMLSQLKTPEQIRARREAVRASMLRLIGGMPAERTPLNAAVTGGFERDGYRVENVIFHSQPRFRVTANLYLPKSGKPPYPALLGVAGHSNNGKASATYQTAWIGFVKRGYVVLAFDPPGQGERLEYPDESGGSRVGIGVNEHVMAGLQCLLTGTTFARHEIWDGIRAFDYLASRPEVDAKRIAVAGNSGGGTQAAYLAALEPRLASVISSCYMTRWRELWHGQGPQDAEQVWPGFISEGLDFDDFALAFAPKPYLMTTAIRDFFPIDGARATFRVMTEIFERLGVSQNAGYFEYDDTHGWSKPRREAAARWLDKHLKGASTDGAEPAIDTEPESRLYAAWGVKHPALAEASTTVRQINHARALEMHARRKAASVNDPAALRTLIQERLGLSRPLPALRTREMGEQQRDGLLVKTLELESEGRRSIPARMLTPAGLKTPAAALLTIGAGRDAEELARGGRVVLALEPAGFGDNAPRDGTGYSASYKLAARAWLLGKNLPGMAVEDTLAAHAWLRDQRAVDARRIAVFGVGGGGVIALLAAALEPGLSSVAAERMPASYLSFTAAQIHRNLASLVIPGVLEDFDLPDVVKLMGDRRLYLTDPVRGGGARYLPGELADYPRARFIERAEGWPVERVYKEWLAPYSNR